MFPHHASSYRCVSPLFLLPVSLSDGLDSLDPDKFSAAASWNWEVFLCIAGAGFPAIPIGTSAGSSFGIDFAYAAGGKLAGNSFATGEIAGSGGFKGAPFAKGIWPLAGTKIHCPRGCSGGGLSAA